MKDMNTAVVHTFKIGSSDIATAVLNIPCILERVNLRKGILLVRQ